MNLKTYILEKRAGQIAANAFWDELDFIKEAKKKREKGRVEDPKEEKSELVEDAPNKEE